ncbi:MULTISPECIES: hypothetical protein [unclassified Rhizobacter]|uniref:hypothetical protein n=1 Tax=unclassified Rhizobacter TaxID=2640088 RepID=UPI000AC57FA3|nr:MULTISPECIES: hypothetical protein [unclassified Rhizobacter]
MSTIRANKPKPQTPSISGAKNRTGQSRQNILEKISKLRIKAESNTPNDEFGKDVLKEYNELRMALEKQDDSESDSWEPCPDYYGDVNQ